jgi:hypothetical protein
LFTRRSSRCLLPVVLSLASLSAAQALTPAEIKQPQLRALQEKYFQQLQAIGAEIQGHIYPYSFYFSRVLDLELVQQQRADQRSLRFDNYSGLTVVELTGNYFASYSAEMVDKSHRALRTFQDVMLPIVEIAMPELKDIPEVEGFAMEISHHVRGKAMGMNMERPENLVLVLSKDAALRLVNAKTENDRQAAILDGQFFINGEPFILYLSDRAAQEAARVQAQNPETPAARDSSRKRKSSKPAETAAAAMRPLPRMAPPDPPPAAPRDTSPEALTKIQASYQKMIDLVAKEVDSQAHFVSYAPPAIVAFRKGAYLEFSISTTVPASAGSRYKMAALAFDDHIAHLIRPVMAYFKGDLDFDGVAFSTTIHQQQDKAPSAQGSEAVEFFFPTSALRCYETYDCTGQQLIDQGSVLINGERVSLVLQDAEAEAGNR